MRDGGGAAAETDSAEDDGGVETKAVEGNVEGEPRPSAAEENLEVGPLGVVTGEVASRGRGDFDALNGLVLDRLEFTSLDEVGVLLGLSEIALDIHGVPGGLRDGETVVEGDDGRDSAETDDKTPHAIDDVVIGIVLDVLLEGDGDDKSDETKMED